MSSEKKRILLIDDEEEAFKLISFPFSDYEWIWKNNFNEGIEMLNSREIDLIFLDLALNGNDYEQGIPNLELLKKQFPNIPVIIISNANSSELGFEASQLGADFYLDKRKYDILVWKKVISDCLQKILGTKIFISHSTKDEEFVTKLDKSLKKIGADTWVNDITPGNSLAKDIKKGLKSADFVVLILTPNSIESAWVKEEIDIALQLEDTGEIVKLIPVLRENCKIPKIIKERYYVDFTKDDNFGDNLFELKEGLKKQFGSLKWVSLIFSHEDMIDQKTSNGRATKKVIDDFIKFLKPLKRNKIRTWTRNDMNVGDDVHKQLIDAIDKSDCIIPLLSSNYLNDATIEKCKKAIVKRGSKKGIGFLPVILKVCIWKNEFDEKLSSYSCLPQNGSLTSSDIDLESEFMEISETIVSFFEQS